MASADDVIGLSRETGIDSTAINKVYGDLGRNSNGDLEPVKIVVVYRSS